MANLPRLDKLAVAANSRGCLMGCWCTLIGNLTLQMVSITYGLSRLSVQMKGNCLLLNWRELAVAGNSNNLTDTMSVYIQREINTDLQFAVGLSQLWDVLYIRVNEIRMLSSELNVFAGPLAVQCAEFLKQFSQTEVLRMLELRKTMAEVHMQVHKKIDGDDD
ncbi:hypothetical protein Tco_0999305 [Tanacetum coccineum]